MSHWDRRELNKLVPVHPDEYKKKFPEPFSAMIPEDASSENKLATEKYVSEHGGSPDAVKYTEQSLTAEQKAQALSNIGAASDGDVAALADQKYEGPYATDGDLPAASASTMGAIYLVGPDANDEYERKVTKLSGSTYSWCSLGKTSIDLANYATKAEVGELEAKVGELDVQLNGITITSVDAEAGKIYSATGYVASTKYAVSKVLPAGKITISTASSQSVYTAKIFEHISDNEGEALTNSFSNFSSPGTYESENGFVIDFRKNAGADNITATDISAINALFSVVYDSSNSIVNKISRIETSLESLKSAGYIFVGVANRTTNPGTPTNKVFYLATEVGIYTNFGDLSVALNDGAIALCFNGSNWAKVILDIAPNNILMPGDVEIAGETADTYIKSNGDIGSLTGVKTDYIVVIAGDIFQMKISGAVGSSNYAWAFYSATPFSSATLVSRGPASASANGTHLVVAPQNGYLVRTLVNNATYEIKQYKAEKIGNILNELSESHPALRYSLAEGVLKVAFGYGDKDFVVEMQKTGGNNIFDFNKFSTIVKGGKLGVDTETTVMSISTDWHSPFLVAAVNNADGDDITSHYFTGGNHQYNNTGSGSTATGRTTSLTFFVDGNAITAGSGFADMVEVRWTNRVQGYNTRKADGTGREILQENHRLIITAGKFSESVEVIPLEDVSFEKWYGFQFSGRATIYPNVLFIGATNKGVITSADGSGTKLSNRVLGFGNNHRVKMFVDNAVDLGQRYALSAVSGAITAGNNKGYFQILDNLLAGSGEHYYLEGGWEFSTP